MISRDTSAHTFEPTLSDEDLLAYSESELLRDDFSGKLKPILDIVFVRLFDKENDYHLLKTFLNDFLDLKESHRITRVESMLTRMTGDHAGEKEPVIDLLVNDQLGRKLHIELQLSAQPYYLNRALYYGARIYSAQLHSGDDYDTLGQTICIHILSWNLFLPETEWPEYVTPAQLCELHRGRVINDQLQFWFVELLKFRPPLEHLHDRREKWLYFLKHADRVGDDQLRRLNMGELLEANDKLKKISRDKDMRYAYLGKMKAEHDAISFRNGYLREGFQKGLETGKELGRAEGIDLGRAEGIDLGRAEGIDLGRAEGLKRGLIRLAEKRLGAAPTAVLATIEALDDTTVLEQLFDRALTATSWQELGADISG